MNKNSYLSEAEGPVIETSEILGFLIKRCNDLLASDRPLLPICLQALGQAALGEDEQLCRHFKESLSSVNCSPEENLRNAIQVLKTARDQIPAECSGLATGTGDHEIGEKACRHVQMRAHHEGKLMLEEKDYRFLRVFEVLGWIGLQCDKEWLAEFEAVRRRFANDPVEMIEQGRDILRDALFRRRPSDRVQPEEEGPCTH